MIIVISCHFLFVRSYAEVFFARTFFKRSKKVDKLEVMPAGS